jgi:hypothetical protein
MVDECKLQCDGCCREALDEVKRLELQNDELATAVKKSTEDLNAMLEMLEDRTAKLNVANRLINDLRSALNDVLDISEVEGAVNLTTMESAKIMAARDFVHQHDEKRICVPPGYCHCKCHETSKVTGEANGCGCCSYNV